MTNETGFAALFSSFKWTRVGSMPYILAFYESFFPHASVRRERSAGKGFIPQESEMKFVHPSHSPRTRLMSKLCAHTLEILASRELVLSPWKLVGRKFENVCILYLFRTVNDVRSYIYIFMNYSYANFSWKRKASRSSRFTQLRGGFRFFFFLFARSSI